MMEEKESLYTLCSTLRSREGEKGEGKPSPILFLEKGEPAIFHPTERWRLYSGKKRERTKVARREW
ncbi:MAG: hypothetical protein D6704_08400 [Nitrospirae bacterium]|nr:MAG: hypothetical protein D6704_08400 [Nitrospirota bacterium]